MVKEEAEYQDRAEERTVDTPCKDALSSWGPMLWNKGFKYKGHYFFKKIFY